MIKYFPSLFLFLISLALGWASFSQAQKLLPAIIPNFYPAVEAQVVHMNGDFAQVGQAKIFVLREAEVKFDWAGQTYTSKETGYDFSYDDYKQALQTKRCTVYVNREQPSLSLLSTAMPVGQFFFCGLFAVLSLVLFLFAFKKYPRSSSSGKL